MLRAEETEAAGIEKKIEFVHPHAEDAREDEVSELVDNDEYGKGQDDLEYLYQYCHYKCQFEYEARISDALALASALISRKPPRVVAGVESETAMVSLTMAGMS